MWVQIGKRVFNTDNVFSVHEIVDPTAVTDLPDGSVKTGPVRYLVITSTGGAKLQFSGDEAATIRNWLAQRMKPEDLSAYAPKPAEQTSSPAGG